MTTRRAAAVLLAAAVVVAPGVMAAPAAHADAGESISSYLVSVDIAKDSTLQVSETITYDFAGSDHHGVFRKIPVADRYDNTYDRIIRISDVQVSSPTGAPSDVQTSTDKGVETLKIGNPDRTVSGRQTYVISYRVAGAMNAFTDQDELVWNVVGVDWPVPIAGVRATVTAPADILKVNCITGEAGSFASCTSARTSGPTATVVGRDLTPYEGLTVAVALPKGAVEVAAPILVERWSLTRAFAANVVTVPLALLVLVLCVGGVLRLVWTRGRDKRFVGEVPGLEPPPGVAELEASRPMFDKGNVVVEFAPPPDMRPGLAGTLIDERANVLDVTSTIIDLAVRGYLRIEEIPKQGLFGKPDWSFVALKAADDTLLPYETRVLGALFSVASPTLALVAKAAATDFKLVQNDLYQEVVGRKWFRGRPDHVRAQWAFLGGLLAAVGAGVVFLLARFTHLGLLGVGVLIAGVVMLGASRFMPSRTGRGSAALSKVLGFQTYIKTAEAEQIRFEERTDVFSRYLPYAMVFGEAERWAKNFAAVGVGTAAAGGVGGVGYLPWYVGAPGWSMNDFGSSIDAFTVTTAGSISAASAATGASGFGGGGFSGGGFGGGGGGSW